MADRFWDSIRRLYGPNNPSAPRSWRERSTQPQPARQTIHMVPAPTPAPVSIPQQQVQEQYPVEQQQQYEALDNNGKKALIHEAGQKRMMLDITYDGVSRLIEPYSYRTPLHKELLFAHCSIHDRIHSFSLDKISSMKITEFEFAPRWDIEV